MLLSACVRDKGKLGAGILLSREPLDMTSTFPRRNVETCIHIIAVEILGLFDGLAITRLHACQNAGVT